MLLLLQIYNKLVIVIKYMSQSGTRGWSDGSEGRDMCFTKSH